MIVFSLFIDVADGLVVEDSDWFVNLVFDQNVHEFLFYRPEEPSRVLGFWIGNNVSVAVENVAELFLVTRALWTKIFPLIY